MSANEFQRVSMSFIEFQYAANLRQKDTARHGSSTTSKTHFALPLEFVLQIAVATLAQRPKDIEHNSNAFRIFYFCIGAGNSVVHRS